MRFEPRGWSQGGREDLKPSGQRHRMAVSVKRLLDTKKGSKRSEIEAILGKPDFVLPSKEPEDIEEATGRPLFVHSSLAIKL